MKTDNLLTLLISIIFSLVLLEIGLRYFTPYPVNRSSNKVIHEALGYVLDPSMEEIDEHGFRNNALPSIDIVALGDSHTYGFNVTSDDSWPKQLGRRLERNVYNFGMGGFGILQYQYLLNKSIEMHPEVILLGLYLANDLNDMCKRFSKSQYWKTKAKELHFDRSLCPERYNVQNTSWADTDKAWVVILWEWLTENFAITSMASEYYSYYSALQTIENGEITNGIIINDGTIRTVIGFKKIRAHLEYMDISKPNIQMAYTALKIILLEARQNTESNNIRLGVFFIPSKERVFYSHLVQTGHELPEAYRELVNNEDTLKANLSIFLENTGIPFIDVLPDMENALLEYGNIYPARDDGHPNSTGYKIYSESAFDLYQQINK